MAMLSAPYYTMPRKPPTAEKRREYQARHIAKDPEAYKRKKAKLNREWIQNNRG